MRVLQDGTHTRQSLGQPDALYMALLPAQSPPSAEKRRNTARDEWKYTTATAKQQGLLEGRLMMKLCGQRWFARLYDVFGWYGNGVLRCPN